ncbi:hypothetical protein BDR22DRAFT_228611 [Usnea florida]
MGRRVKELDPGAERKEHQITEALDRKRRQVDLEIAEFKAEKEREYRAFERQLRSRSKDNGVQDAPQSQRKRDRSKQKDVAEASPMQKEEANQVQRQTNFGEPKQKRPESGATDLNAIIPSISSLGESPVFLDRPRDTLGGREKEFEGLHTPSHLPLVEDTLVDKRTKSREPFQPPSFTLEDLAALRRNGNAMLSSSAEIAHPPMTSPPLPPSRPLSSSVPPAKPSHHRSDSTRSDNSIASLRSSLRDPKQPRSPKRVLFSIDDTLVSPSTSPIAQRSNSAVPVEKVDPIDAIGGFEKFEVVRNQNDNGPTFTRPQSDDADVPSFRAPANGWATSLPTFRCSKESSISNGLRTAGEAGNLEYLESDDLFSFDEEMGWADNRNLQETDLDDKHDEDVAVDEKKNKLQVYN